MPNITIDYETADRITYENLKESLSTLEDMVEKDVLHEDDTENYNDYIKAIKVLLKYYGG